MIVPLIITMVRIEETLYSQTKYMWGHKPTPPVNSEQIRHRCSSEVFNSTRAEQTVRDSVSLRVPHSLKYLAGFLLLSDALGLLVLLGALCQVGVVGQTTEQGGHLRPSVHLLLWDKERQEGEGKGGGDAQGRNRVEKKWMDGQWGEGRGGGMRYSQGVETKKEEEEARHEEGRMKWRSEETKRKVVRLVREAGDTRLSSLSIKTEMICTRQPVYFWLWWSRQTGR